MGEEAPKVELADVVSRLKSILSTIWFVQNPTSWWKPVLEDAVAEIDRLRAELASRQIDIDTFCEGNQKLRAELAAKFDEYCRNLTELAQTHKESCDAKDARIAELIVSNQELCADNIAKDARIAELEGASEDTPFEAVHAHIREGVLRAAEEIRQRDDVRAAHEIMASACQRAANRLNSELREMVEVRARAERAEAERDALLYNADSQYCAGMSAGFELGRNDDRAELSRIITQRWVEIADAKARAALNPSPSDEELK